MNCLLKLLHNIRAIVLAELLLNYKVYTTGRDFSVSTVRGYGLDGRSSIPGRGKRFFSSAQSPDRILGPPSLLCNG
jgi:hypothetical protein